MANNKSPAKKLRSYKRFIKFILSKSSQRAPVLTVCCQSPVTILPVSKPKLLLISPLLPINIMPRLNTLSRSKPTIIEIPPSLTSENSPLNLPEVFSQLQTMQTTIIELQRDYQEQLKLKDEEMNIYRRALSSLGVPLPNRK